MAAPAGGDQRTGGLLRRRGEVEGLLQHERNRREHLAPHPGLHGAVPQSVERLIAVLEEELKQIEQAITCNRLHPSRRDFYMAQARVSLVTLWL